MASTKTAQVSIRIPEVVLQWLDRRAGSARSRADIVRELLEEEMRREDAARLTEMFDAAAADLTPEEREDRDRLLGALSREDE
ncbi:MAG: hypothetical protein ABR559_04245 [Gemmatimonadota bacterium]